ncbi:hypothetical protein [Schaalia hyovaginalis]|uniref:hypothetical protein n=1 Tax=Schaalia hyovaginalis TaxID=29316 RepID=UPI0026EBFD19|nr:hypothetical protein [Schaalia hyovaginalis]MDD7554494.1 hypothetical protein [Schaalia hyovaginalis]
MDASLTISRSNVVAGVVARHLHRVSAKGPFGAKDCFDGPTLNLFESLTPESACLCLGSSKDVTGNDERPASDDGRGCEEFCRPVEFDHSTLQTLIKLSGASPCGLRAQAPNSSLTLKEFKTIELMIPVVDFRPQARQHLCPGSFSFEARALDELMKARLQPLTEGDRPRCLVMAEHGPLAFTNPCDSFSFCGVGTVVLHVWGNASKGHRPVLGNERIVEMPFRSVMRGGFDPLLDAEHEHRRLGLTGASINEHRAPLQGRAEILDRHLDECIEKRMPWSNKRSIKLAIGMHEGALEGYALVLPGQRSPPIEASSRLDHPARDPRDLIPALLSPANPSSQARESGNKERGNVSGLEAALACPFHSSADFIKIQGGEHLRVECPLGDHFMKAIGHARINDPIELRLHLRLIPISDRFDEKVAQGPLLESILFSEDIEEIALVGR